jgi:hypothetical protein
MFTKLKADIRELITDDSKRLSLAKTMLLCGWLFVSGFIWKLIVQNQMTPEYLVIYIALISGQHLASKWLDKKDDNPKP